MVFHVERNIKTLFKKGFLLLLAATLFTSCIAQRGNLQIEDYTLQPNGKQVMGHKQGLTAFIFENNPRKIPFAQFIADKFGLGSYQDIEFPATIDGHNFKVYVYENAELEKYFDMSQYMVTMSETEQNIKGSTAKFIGLSIVDSYNQDCLTSESLYQNIAIKYLLNLKNEYYNL